jgi:signal transduction histidine kinase
MPNGGQANHGLARAELERLGELTGSVAHDFNNLLTVILNCVDEACRLLPADSPAVTELELAKLASRQGTNLVARLLGSKHPSTAADVHIGALLQGARPLLQRTVGAGTAVVLEEEPAPWQVRIDPTELWQVVLNLITNAHEAMPNGGRLSIRVRNLTLATFCTTRTTTVPAGDYVVVEVTDTGCGMDQTVQARMFDAFFSTKGTAGRGLGLATVGRLVETAGGGIRVASQVGVGTRIEVLLPRSRG